MTMLRSFATGVVLLAVGALLAAPVPNETRKPAAFPAGRYVLTGAGEPAQGDDVYEFNKPFRLKPGQYILSGGSKPTATIAVDDDLELSQDGTLFVDDDGVSTTNRGKQAARYQGHPIVLVLDPSKKLRVVAIDRTARDASIGTLFLHRWDGAAKKLTSGKSEQSAENLPNTFFDESFELTDGFEVPKDVSTDATIDVPEKPALLLPRFKPADPVPARPARADAPKVPEVGEFISTAMTNGLTEDGVALDLAAEIAKRDDFLGKCEICTKTHAALLAYSQLKKQPVAKKGKGLPDALVERLKSNDDDKRRAALRELVQRCVEAEYARLKLSAGQQLGLQKALDEMRGGQAKGLPVGRKFCPSCDGVCCLAPKP
jgi:hypothetical protein